MWTTRRAKQAIVSPRPVRVAYVVPNPPSHELLDALFDEAMSRWGGRRTPIVQSDGADLGVDDWKLLGLWDADIIYSYMNLDGALHRRLGGIELGDRRLGGVGLARVLEEAGPPDQHPGGLGVHHHVGDHRLDELEAGEGDSELLALLRVVD